MSQVVVGGRATAVPGVYGNTKYATAARRAAPAGKVLTVVGAFPFLKPGTFTSFAGPSALTRAVPGNPIVDQIANVAFSPASDPKIRGAATEIVLASTLPSLQSFLQLVDKYSVEAVRLKSRLWGALGNQTGVQIAADSTDALLRDVVLGRSGTPDVQSDLGSGPVLEVTYTPGAKVTKAYLACRSPLLDAETGDATAELELIAKIPALAGAATTTTLASNERAADGKVTIQPSAAVTGDTTFTITGINKATGLADSDTVLILDAVTAPGTTTKEFSRVDTIALSPSDAVTFQVSWPIRRITKSNASYVSDVAAILNDVPLVTATIKNAQASYMPIGSLDALPSADVTTPTSLRADAWAAVETINARSTLAEAERVIPTSAPTITRQGTTGVATLTAGSTVTSGFTSTSGLLPGDVLLFGTTATDPAATLVVASVDSGTAVTLESASPVTWIGGPVWLLRPAVPRHVQPFSGGTAAVTAVDATANTLTVGAGHPFQAGDAVTLEIGTGGTLPGGYTAGTVVYIGDATITGATVKVYDAPGGSVIDLTAGFVAPVTMTRLTQTRYMAGGSDGVETSASRLACFEALRDSETAVLVPLSTAAELVQACVDHAAYMAGPGARELCVWAGLPVNTTYDAGKALTVGYNTRHLAVAKDEVRLLDSRGRRVWFGPQWQALQMASMQCAVGIAVPITSKRPRAIETRSHASWTTAGQSATILAGVNCYAKDNLGLKVLRAVTTHLASEDVAQTEVSANESVNWSIRDLRDFLYGIVGESSADVEPNAIKGIAIGRLRKQVQDKRITSFGEEFVDITRYDDVVRVGYPLRPAVPTNFVIVEPTVESVVFELTLN